jgi:UDP-GlcNAc:undecaprenyl-phosphate GlcNAc-1-phosphate transferase
VRGLLAILAEQAAGAADKAEPQTRLSIFEGYIGVLVISFLVTLFATPLMRRLAVANGVIDRPSDPRKVHRVPIAYLGGVAVFLGLLGGIFYSYMAMKFPYMIDFHQAKAEHLRDGLFHEPVPISVVLGIIVIMIVGVLDDVYGISPRVKIGGQLFAAAALAVDNVGVKLAQGILVPIAKSIGMHPQLLAGGGETIAFNIPLPVHFLGVDAINIDIVYWAGTAVIAIAVLGLCNASNLIDGLDGLLSGTTAISSIGLLILALGLALVDDGPRDGQRIVLCLAVLGACLGFLPHNFNPANIFLGDAGSLLLGFCTCVIILTLGDTGKTHLVAAGVIIYALPIIDTTLAIVRRKMEGKSISAADDQHLHHMLKRALGVRGAVFALYGIAGVFAVIGAGISLVRARIIYLLAMVLAAYIGVTAIKIARRRFIEAQAGAYDARKAAKLVGPQMPERQHEEAAPTTGENAPASPILVASAANGKSGGPAPAG